MITGVAAGAGGRGGAAGGLQRAERRGHGPARPRQVKDYIILYYIICI